MILAIDTSTPLTSVALVDGTDILVELRHLDARQHAEVLAPMLRDALARTGLGRGTVDIVACGVGPGPYTGLRVGIASARAVGAAWGVPVLGLCSLDAIAAAAVEEGIDRPFGVAGDARRSEVYWALFDAAGTRVDGPRVSPAAVVSDRDGLWVGAGAVAHEADFGTVTGTDVPVLLHPHASRVARRVGALLAAGEVPTGAVVPLSAHGSDGSASADALQGSSLLPPVPLYLRRPDAVESRPA